MGIPGIVGTNTGGRGGMGEAHGKAQTNAWLTHNPDKGFCMNFVVVVGGRMRPLNVPLHILSQVERHYQAMC